MIDASQGNETYRKIDDGGEILYDDYLSIDLVNFGEDDADKY